MNKTLLADIVQLQVRSGKSLNLRVSGISMEPTLHEGDLVKVESKAEYEIGDILVFRYKESNILVHRLLQKDSKSFFCKGDNAFRFEEIDQNHIIGTVTKINGNQVVDWSDELIDLSYAVGQVFSICGNIDMVKTRKVYKKYKALLANTYREP